MENFSRRRLTSAFTLIELLVVIAIIAILAAILFPVFAQAKAAAKQTVPLSNIKQVALGARMYAGDSDDTGAMTIQSCLDSGGNWIAGDPYKYVGHLQLVYPYTKNSGVFWNGLDPKPAQSAAFPERYTPVNPAVSETWGPWTSLTTIAGNAVALNGWNGSNIFPRQESQYTDPAALVIYAPIITGSTGVGAVDWNPYYETCVNDVKNKDFWLYQASVKHNNSVVSGYADGHAARQKVGTFLTGASCTSANFDKFTKTRASNRFYGWYLDGIQETP